MKNNNFVDRSRMKLKHINPNCEIVVASNLAIIDLFIGKFVEIEHKNKFCSNFIQ